RPPDRRLPRSIAVRAAVRRGGPFLAARSSSVLGLRSAGPAPGWLVARVSSFGRMIAGRTNLAIQHTSHIGGSRTMYPSRRRWLSSTLPLALAALILAAGCGPSAPAAAPTSAPP